jgi:hypothetical protein
MKRAGGAIGAAKQLGLMVSFAASGLVVATLEESRFTLAILMTCVAVTGALLVALSVREVRHAGSDAGGGTHAGGGAMPSEGARPPAAIELLKEGVRLLRGDRRFRRLVLLALFTDSFGLYLSGLIQPHFLRIGVPGVWFGLAFSVASGLAFLGTRYAYVVDRWLGPRRALLLATGMPGAIYLALALVLHPVGAVALYCAFGGVAAVGGPLLSAYQNARIPDASRATVLSVVGTMGSLYTGAAGLALGWLADVSVRGSFVVMGVVVLAGALLLRVDAPEGERAATEEERASVMA